MDLCPPSAHRVHHGVNDEYMDKTLELIYRLGPNVWNISARGGVSNLRFKEKC